jgi:hypothetical protein
MGCGCNKNKNQNGGETANPTSFRSVINEAAKPSKMSMVKSFAAAIASRGLSDKRVSLPEKKLRVLSCFGNANMGGELTPCEHLKQSTTPGKYFCGGCGCGDKPHTWLMAEEQNYSKLDYPKLNCPLNMPGFTNYQPSAPDEAEEPITRRYYIENMDFNDVFKTPVSMPEPPVQKEQPQDTQNKNNQ